MLLFLVLACAADTTQLEARNDALEAEVVLLEGQVASLEARVEELEEARRQDQESDERPTVLGGALRGDTEAPPPCIQDAEGRYLLPGGVSTDQLAAAGRIIPHREGTGEQDGFRVSGIRRESLAATCGLKNGDVVHALGEVPLTEVAALAEAWQLLEQGAPQTLKVTRRGEDVELVLQLSGG